MFIEVLTQLLSDYAALFGYFVLFLYLIFLKQNKNTLLLLTFVLFHFLLNWWAVDVAEYSTHLLFICYVASSLYFGFLLIKSGILHSIILAFNAFLDLLLYVDVHFNTSIIYAVWEPLTLFVTLAHVGVGIGCYHFIFTDSDGGNARTRDKAHVWTQ
jgi:hypothetical protein